MVKSGKLYALHQFAEILNTNPRYENLKFHKSLSPYKTKDASYKLVRQAFENNIIVGPFLYCNYGFKVDIIRDDINPLKILRDLESENSSIITHAIALSGDDTLLTISKGGNQLMCAEAIFPSFAPKLDLCGLTFSQKGALETDLLPQNWNSLDWEVFHAMRNPRISFMDVGRMLGITWATARRHYLKILKDCKSLVAFYPKGYGGYDRLLVTFKTEYETGLRESLGKLDRSSYLWKFDDTIILILFVDDYNGTCERFTVLEEMGMIHDLRISVPIRYYVPPSILEWEDQVPHQNPMALYSHRWV